MTRTTLLVSWIFTYTVAATFAVAAGADDSTPKSQPQSQLPAANTLRPEADADSPPEQPVVDASYLPANTPESDRQLYERLLKTLNDPESEYRKAEAAFKQLDKQLTELDQAIAKLGTDGKADELAKLQQERLDLQARWKLAKDRFELAVEERKTLELRLAALAEKVEKDRQAREVNPALQPPAATNGNPAPLAADNNSQPAVAADAAAPNSSSPADAQAAQPTGNNTQPNTGTAATGDATPAKPPSKELLEAQKKAEQTQQAAQLAELQAMSTAERMDALRKNIELGKKLLEMARRKVDNAQEALLTAQDMFQDKSAEGAPPNELLALARAADDAQQRFVEARKEARQRTDDLNDLQAQLTALQVEHIATLREAEEMRKAADEAQQRVARLQNPFALENIVNWLVVHGPHLLMIVAGMLLVYWLFTILCRRFAELMTRASDIGSAEDRAARARVLAGFLRPLVTFVILTIGVLMILDELEVPVLPLWTTVSAVLAMVAIGFVAVWSVLSNTLCSVILLIFQPFSIGNTIELTTTGVRGKVINFNMLFTTLRGEDGDLIEMPNNTFFQQPIRRRIGNANVSLDEQLLKEQPTE